MIRSSLHSGKTAGDLAKERNKLEVSRRIDQVPPAKNLTEKLSKNLVSRPKKWAWRIDLMPPAKKIGLSLERDGFLWFLDIAQSMYKGRVIWYDALADLGSFKNIGKRENLRVRLALPKYPCNAIPYFFGKPKDPQRQREKKDKSSEAIIFHGKSVKANGILSQIAL